MAFGRHVSGGDEVRGLWGDGPTSESVNSTMVDRNALDGGGVVVTEVLG